jgi:hypothetical protein
MAVGLIWVACAAVIITAAIRSRRNRRWLRTGRAAVATLFIGAGAAANTFFLLRGDDYAEFADGAYIPFVRDTWRSLVVPNVALFVGALIAFELAVGVLVARGGKRTQLGYVALIAFHVGVCSFGWVLYLWSVPMIAAVATLLRGERHQAPPVQLAAPPELAHAA